MSHTPIDLSEVEIKLQKLRTIDPDATYMFGVDVLALIRAVKAAQGIGCLRRVCQGVGFNSLREALEPFKVGGEGMRVIVCEHGTILEPDRCSRCVIRERDHLRIKLHSVERDAEHLRRQLERAEKALKMILNVYPGDPTINAYWIAKEALEASRSEAEGNETGGNNRVE